MKGVRSVNVQGMDSELNFGSNAVQRIRRRPLRQAPSVDNSIKLNAVLHHGIDVNLNSFHQASCASSSNIS
ncbi:hypothetical protein BLOT_006028 [Blomia tropicalis]|nr:hypothetical protein BLOT_006028 [Blomia tropicalis]